MAHASRGGKATEAGALISWALANPLALLFSEGPNFLLSGLKLLKRSMHSMVFQMISRREFALICWFGCLALTAIGCGGTKSGPVEQPLRGALEDFHQFLKNLPTDNLQPPKDVASFMPLEPMAPVAAEYLINGELVYFWGSGLADGGERIIAHQKTMDTDGCWVLLENGKVVKLSAEKFASAPKAK